MRTTTVQQDKLYTLDTRSAWVRVDVADGDGNYQDLTTFLGIDWVIAVEWGEDIDSPMATATVTLARDRNKISLVPEMTASRANVSTSGDPLLQVRRRIKIYANVAPDRTAPTSWVQVFDGFITDLNAHASPVVLTCADRFNQLVERWIETPATYSTSVGVATETVMGSILTDNGAIYALYTPVSPLWNVTEFQTECQSLADELTMLADQIGWSIRWKWDAGTSAYRLTFFSFDRADVTPVYTLGPTNVYDINSGGISTADIRNVVDAIYSDPADLDATGAPTRKTVTASDGASITKYGRKWMSIAEDATSNIDTATEAQALVDACLADLKDPSSILTIECPFLHFVELGDIHTLSANSVHNDTDLIVTVQGYRHSFTAKRSRTTLTVRVSPMAGGAAKWFEISGTPGIARLHDAVGPPAPTVTVTEGNASIDIQPVASRRPDIIFEVHTGAPLFAADLSGGSATIRHRHGSRSRVHTDTSFPIGELQDVLVYAVDGRGNRSTATRVSGKAAKRVGPQMLDPKARIGAGFPGAVFYLQTRGTSYPPDGWSIRTGAWATDADLDSGAIYAAPRTGKYGLLLKSTATATLLYSDPIAVTAARTYQVQTEFKAANAVNTITVAIEWLDADLATLSTANLYNSAAASSGAWQQVSALVSPPPSTAYARVTVSKAAAAFNVLFDRFIFDECPEVDNAIHGYRIVEDFPGGSSVGSLDWSLTLLGADTATNPTVPSKVAAAASTERGILRLTTPGAGNYGGVLSLGAADGLYGLPSVGSVFKIKVKVDTGTNVAIWAGIFDTTSLGPDAPLVNSLHGLGIRGAAGGGAANWKVIARDGTNETSVDIGVAVGSTYRTIGFRRTLTGIQPMLGDHDVGAEITTNIPALSACSILMGAYETSASARAVDVDFVSFFANERRYDP